jgi:hypothetical protein
MGPDRSPDSPPLCARCGSPLASDARFCGHCGLTVSADAGQRPAIRPDDGWSHPGPGAADSAGTIADFLAGIDALKRYPAIVAPPLIAMCVVFALAILFFGSAMGLFVMGGFAWRGRGPGMIGAAFGTVLLALAFLAAAMMVNLISSAVVVVMAGDVLAKRTPSLTGGYGRVVARLGDVLGASILCALIIGVASVFFLVPGVIAAFFLMFAMPAVLLAGAGPIESLRRSATLVRDNVGRALGLVAGTIIACVVAWIASMALHVIPVIGHLVSVLIGGVLVAYLTVVLVRVFQTLPRG